MILFFLVFHIGTLLGTSAFKVNQLSDKNSTNLSVPDQLAALEKNVDALRKELVTERMERQHLQKELVRRSLTDARKLFGFTAKTDDPYWFQSSSSGALIFPNVVDLVGGGYDSSTGVYTVPHDGLYVFYCTLSSTLHNYVYAYLLINGSEKVSVVPSAHSDFLGVSSSSNLLVVNVHQGDRVWISIHHSSYSSGQQIPGWKGLQTFSGFML